MAHSRAFSYINCNTPLFKHRSITESVPVDLTASHQPNHLLNISVIMTSSLLDQYRYTISDITLLDPPVSIFHKLTFLIEIAKITGRDNELLKPVEGKFGKNQIVWSEQTLYDVTAESIINFKILMKKGRKGVLEAIGEYTNTVSGLLDKQKSSGMCKVILGQKSQLSFKVKGDRFKDMLKVAKQQSEGIYFTPGVSWSTFLTYFEIVKTAVDSVASLNPYAQQAWSIVSMVPNILQTHATRNSNVQKLFERLVDIYKYINEADRLSTLTDTQSEKLKLLIHNTCECADFIKKYMENNAAENLIKGPIFDDRISEFKGSFDQLFETIRDSLTLRTAIAALNIEDSNLLADMPYATNVGFVHGKKCLPGTRQKLIREILEWVDKDTSERVLILSGQAGTGKSAVAHTIAETLGDRLGSFFCFNRGDRGRVDFLFSTISRNLADRDDLWRRNLVQAIKDIAIRKSFDPITQFKEMIIKSSIGTTKRMVIIIDALDESGDQKEREILLNLLFIRSSELQSNHRIIITSRPEDDIEQFHQHSNVFCKYMADVDPDDTLHDIQQFILDKLSAVAKILDVVDENWHLLLAQKAQSLFQWAKIACDHILELKLKAAQRLRTVLSKPTSSLYEMYHQILDDQPDFRFDSYLTLLKIFVGAVIVSRKPLTVSALQAFFGPISGDGMDVRAVLKLLNSLFIGINESTAEIRPIHTSLLDFFLSPEQKPETPNRYYIDTSDQSSFTHACLRVMNEMLRFNICELETSHLRNRDIPNFDSRVAEAIPLHLSYACCFWAYHLEYSHLNPDLLKEISDLMHDKLLYFFEVLSLLGEVEHGRAGMQILKNEIKDENSKLAAWAAEASQFAFEFGRMMTESTPHLYLSSLPYIAFRSFISQRFLPQYPQLLGMNVGQPIALQPEIKDSITQRHPSARPSAVAFSPQGRQIACGFDNGDFWVWDYVTGEMVIQVGHKAKATIVFKVVFSSNGELVYCCFRDGSILTWNAKTNKTLYESNEEFTSGKCHACTISPDGRHIAFRHNQTLSFYERETRLKLFEDSLQYFTGMFSPSGSLFGFLSQGGALRLWDTQRQMFIPAPCASITEPWKLEALNDNYIIAHINPLATVFKDREVQVWDIQTGRIVRRFEMESRFQGECTFSTNGEYLLRYEGNQYWIWRISTGEITRRSVGHVSGNAGLTALSPDSKYIAFAMSNSNTTHVLAWDALVQEGTEYLNEDDDIGNWKLVQNPYCHGAWLKGQHLLWEVRDSISSGGYLQVLDTTRMNGLKIDFQVDFSYWMPPEVSPEDNHWSIAYVDMSQADLLCLWNIDKKKEFILDNSDGKVTTFSFSATGDRLISGDSKGNIKVWDVRTRQLISRGGSSNEVIALDFSRMGSTFWLAYGTNEEPFIEERECSASQNIINGPFPHDSTNRSISVSSNNAYICLCSESRTQIGSYDLRLLDRSTGASIGCFNTYPLARVSSNQCYIAWIPEEGPKKVKLWDLEKGIALDGHPFDGNVTEFVFSNDSRRISILGNAGDKQHVDIWDIETKGLVVQLFFSNLQFKQTRGWCTMALYKDSLILVDKHEMGRIWDVHVHEIMTRLYDDNLENSQFGMLPEHLRTRRLIEDYKLGSENTKTLEYALVAWNKASFSPSTKSADGWMLGPHGELLFWVPQEMRSGLLYPSMSFTTKPTKLNFDRFVHGARWTECRTQPKP